MGAHAMNYCSTEQKADVLAPNGNTCCVCQQPAYFVDLCKEHFCAQIEEKVQQTIIRFSMFTPVDKIMVAYSGGKDSTVLLYILKKLGYAVEALTLNAYIGCYSKENVHNATLFTKKNAITLHHISFREEFGYSLCYLRSLLQQKGANLKSCTICGVLRRYLLNKHARAHNATKIAFGHNLDDEAQVILMNVLKGQLDQIARLGPVNGLVQDSRFVQRVKPLYFVTEEEVIAYSRIKEFPVHYGACPCSVDSYRYFIRQIIKKYELDFPQAKQNIVELFLRLSPLLKAHYATGQVPSECIKCGEPAADTLCRACAILGAIA